MMRFTRLAPALFAATLATGALAQSSDAEGISTDMTLPDLSSGIKEDGSYVDPRKKSGRRCPDHPYRPGWVMVHPRMLRWRQDIALKVYASKRVNDVVNAGKCTCDLLYPSWDEMRPDIEAVWAEFGNLPKHKWSEDLAGKFYDRKGAIGDTYSSLLSRYGQMCATLE